MRRAITEWGLVLTLVFTVAVALVGVDSFCLRTLREPLALGSELFVRVADGRLALHTQLGDDWKPNEYRAERAGRSWVRGYWNWFAPGVEYHNRLFANGRTIWSLELSLIVPVAVLSIVSGILWRLRRTNKRPGTFAQEEGNAGRRAG